MRQQPKGVSAMKDFREFERGECIRQLRSFFAPDSSVGFTGYKPETVFSEKAYAEVVHAFDLKKKGITEMTDADIAAGVVPTVSDEDLRDISNDLEWLASQGFVESAGDGLYRLTAEGKGLVGPRH